MRGSADPGDVARKTAVMDLPPPTGGGPTLTRESSEWASKQKRNRKAVPWDETSGGIAAKGSTQHTPSQRITQRGI